MTELVRRVIPGMGDYPVRLMRFSVPGIASGISVLGDVEALRRPSLAVFCSVSCPGWVIVQLHEALVAVREAGLTVISGFHSPVEKEMLPVLLRGTQPVVWLPARRLAMRGVTTAERDAVAVGKLVIVSVFDERDRRPTAALAARRNAVAAALADEVLILHAEPGSRLISLAEQCVAWGKPVITLQGGKGSGGEDNEALVAAGARAVTAERWLRR